ncbi:MAG: hypothetical protein U0Z44_13585 [Kouleothrix sp.]|jgi:hypothetical protein|nr:hypothetical protein [Kouleothrix sp.]
MSSKYRNDDAFLDDDQDEPQFQRLRKQTGKPQTVKESRKQEAREFGRAVNKYFKQRRKLEGPGKP